MHRRGPVGAEDDSRAASSSSPSPADRLQARLAALSDLVVLVAIRSLCVWGGRLIVDPGSTPGRFRIDVGSMSDAPAPLPVSNAPDANMETRGVPALTRRHGGSATICDHHRTQRQTIQTRDPLSRPVWNGPHIDYGTSSRQLADQSSTRRIGDESSTRRRLVVEGANDRQESISPPIPRWHQRRSVAPARQVEDGEE